jgi:DNA-binding NarL/FixJ family response regulator
MATQLLMTQDSISMGRAKELANEWMAGHSEQSLAQYMSLHARWPLMSNVAAGCRTRALVIVANDRPERVATIADALTGAVVVPLPQGRTGQEIGAKFRRIWDDAVPTSDTAATGDSAASQRPLTAREMEVLGLIALGLDNAEIAHRLTISPATAARHVSNIFDKLQVHNRAMATDAAHRLGLLQ